MRSSIVRVPYVMVVNASFPVKTVPEFIAYAKANPGKVNMASGGVGSGDHLSGELFKIMAGVNMTHVPYRGQAPALTDLLGGQVQVLFATTPGTTDYIRTGKLRALAVTTAARAEVLPDLPIVGNFVPGYEASQWYGIGAPKTTAPEIVDKLNKEINAAFTNPTMKARFADIGGEVLTSWSPKDLVWCLLAAISVLTVNVIRIGLIGLYRHHFETIHGAFGSTIADSVSLSLILAICLLGVRREIFARP